MKKLSVVLFCFGVSVTSFAQYVGIGTTTPTSPLHIVDATVPSGFPQLNVEGSANSAGIRLSNGTTNAAYFFSSPGSVEIGSTTFANTPVILEPGGSASTYFLPNGNVGVGISNPQYKFAAYNSSGGYDGVFGGTGTQSRLALKGDISLNRSVIQSLNDGGNTLLDLNPYGGNVGVGIFLPATLFHVYSDADIWHSFIGGATGRLQIGGQNGNGAVIQSWNPTANTARDIYLQRDGGNVGIGNTNPAARLQVTGREQIDFNSTISVPLLTLNQNNTDYARLGFQNSNGKSFTIAGLNAGSTDALNFYSERNSANILSLSSDNKQNISLGGSVVTGSISTITNSSTLYENLNVDGITIIRFTGNAASSLGGMANGVEGRIIYIEYDGNNSLQLNNNDGSSSAGNRFFLPDATFMSLGNQHGATVIYLGGAWRILARS